MTTNSEDSISKSNTNSPEKKAVVIDPTHPEASPINGVVPPVHSRFRPGDGRQRPGRPAASASYKNWCNELQDWEPADLLAYIQANRGPVIKLCAARDMLSRACPGDLADFEAVCQGRMSLEDARAKGLPTDWLKKVKTRTTTSKDGATETTIEVELKDESHKSLDRVLDRTGGKPHQSQDVNHNIGIGLGIRVVIEDGARPDLPPPPGEAKRVESDADGQ